MTAFETRDRNTCACGAHLDAQSRSIKRPTSWGNVSFQQCAACGSFAQSPEILIESLARWYDSTDYQGTASADGAGYHNYLADEDSRLDEARARFVADLAPHLPRHAEVLEVGAATGSVLVPIREAGHSVRGIDLSEQFVEFGRKRHGLDLDVRDFLAFDAGASRFDMVLMLGTVSNLVEPAKHVRRASEVLKPGGMLVLNLPIADSFVARLYGERFWMFTASVNTFFSASGIRKLLESNGFAVRELRMDRQRPSFGKLAHHARIGALRKLLRATDLAEKRLPFSLPLPGICFVRAERLP